MSRNRSNALRQSGQNYREGKFGNIVQPTNPQGYFSKTGNSDRSKRIKGTMATGASSTGASLTSPPPVSFSGSPSSADSPINYFNDDLPDNIKLDSLTSPLPAPSFVALSPAGLPPSPPSAPSTVASSSGASLTIKSPAPSSAGLPPTAPPPAPSSGASSTASPPDTSTTRSPDTSSGASSPSQPPSPLFNDNDYTPSEIKKIIENLKIRDIAVNFGNIRKYRDLNFNNTENQCAWMCKKQILKKTRGTGTNPTERCNFKNLKLQFVTSKYNELNPNIYDLKISKFTLCHNHIREFLGVKIKKDVLTTTKKRNINDFICFYNVTPKKNGKEVGNLIKKGSNANCIISNNTIVASKKIEIGAELFL